MSAAEQRAADPLDLTLTVRCLVAYEDRRALYKPGKPFQLDEFTREELTGLYLSTLTRWLDRKPVSVVEQLAVLQLIGPDGARNWARIFGDALGDVLGVPR